MHHNIRKIQWVITVTWSPFLADNNISCDNLTVHHKVSRYWSSVSSFSLPENFEYCDRSPNFYTIVHQHDFLHLLDKRSLTSTSLNTTQIYILTTGSRKISQSSWVTTHYPVITVSQNHVGLSGNFPVVLSLELYLFHGFPAIIMISVYFENVPWWVHPKTFATH